MRSNKDREVLTIFAILMIIQWVFISLVGGLALYAIWNLAATTGAVGPIGYWASAGIAGAAVIIKNLITK